MPLTEISLRVDTSKFLNLTEKGEKKCNWRRDKVYTRYDCEITSLLQT